MLMSRTRVRVVPSQFDDDQDVDGLWKELRLVSCSIMLKLDLADTISNYVRATLNPLIHNMVEKPAACSFELDPSKAGPHEDIEKNADHLRLMCQALLDMICTSATRVPV
jgi:hypothetical protein